ncbi:MAG: energy-coupling factor transporter transmembrane component T [Thermodesulfobacteriota bacterium]
MSQAFYRPGRGFFHQAHPAVKLVALFLSFVPPFLADAPGRLLPYLGLVLLAALAAGAGRNLRRVRNLMITLVVMSVLIWLIFHPGRTLWFRLGPLLVMRDSFLYGLTVGLRLCCFILAAAAFLTSTPLEDFTLALARLGLPFRPSFALTLAFRLTPLFIETGQDIALAQKARGLDLDSGSPWQRLRRHAPIIVPVIISGLRRSDQLAMALEARGLGYGPRRSHLIEPRVTWRDWLMLLILVAAGTLMGLGYFLG